MFHFRRLQLGTKCLVSRLKRDFGVKQFILPDLGEKLKSAEIKEYLVSEGDFVKAFQVVAVVETGKATIDLPAKYAGKIVKFHVEAQESCDVGAPLYDIDVEGEEDDGVFQKQEQKSEKLESQKTAHGKADSESRSHSSIRSTPSVRILAKKLNVDIHSVQGTGQKGRIMKEDIIDYDNARNAPVTASKPVPAPKIETLVQADQIKVQMNQFEKGMVHSMTYSNTVPHFNLHEEFDITGLVEMREKLKNSGTKISLFSIIVKTFSLALLDHPKMNASYQPESNKFEYFLNNSHNISVAIDSPNGLAAPNLKNVQNMSFWDIDQGIKNLKDLTDKQQLQNDHLNGGTIALSNVGSISGLFASPLNIPGQCCIVALGKVVTRPVWCSKANSFLPKQVLPVSFGCDHRVLDGATVARFSKHWKHYTEDPYLVFSKLK